MARVIELKWVTENDRLSLKGKGENVRQELTVVRGDACRSTSLRVARPNIPIVLLALLINSVDNERVTRPMSEGRLLMNRAVMLRSR